MSLLKGFKETDTKCSQYCRNVLNFFTACVHCLSGEISKEAAPDAPLERDTPQGHHVQLHPLGSTHRCFKGMLCLKPAFWLLWLWRLS